MLQPGAPSSGGPATTACFCYSGCTRIMPSHGTMSSVRSHTLIVASEKLLVFLSGRVKEQVCLAGLSIKAA